MSTEKQKFLDAASSANVKSVRQLLQKGVAITTQDQDGCDALYHVCNASVYLVDAEQQVEVIRLLVASGADVNQEYLHFSHFTPLIFVCSCGNIQAARVLLELGANINQADEYQYTPLHRAALNGQADTVKLLLENGADPMLLNDSGESAYDLAVQGKKESSGLEGSDYKTTLEFLKPFQTSKPVKTSTRKEIHLIAASKCETLQKMKEHFKPCKVPEALSLLCRYWDANPHFFCGSFEVAADEFGTLKEWFKQKKDASSSIRIFGHDGIDSLFGFWLVDHTPETAPVVYLGGEGEGTTLLAQDFNDFLRLLATNQEYDPFDQTFCEPDEQTLEDNLIFREWILKEFHLKPPEDPMTIVHKAIKKHPSFESWLSDVLS